MNFWISRPIGVMSCFSPDARNAMRPIRVSSPTRTTTPTASPVQRQHSATTTDYYDTRQQMIRRQTTTTTTDDNDDLSSPSVIISRHRHKHNIHYCGPLCITQQKGCRTLCLETQTVTDAVAVSETAFCDRTQLTHPHHPHPHAHTHLSTPCYRR